MAPKVTVSCKTCGKEFAAYQSMIKRGGGEYCSLNCRSQNRKKYATFICEYCNKQIVLNSSGMKSKNRRFCSQECCHLHQRKRAQSTCEYCGKEFTLRHYEVLGNRRFCTSDCAHKYQVDNRVNHTCKHCGKEFLDIRSKHQGKYCFCSNKCRLTFFKGIMSPHWRGGYSRTRGENWAIQRGLALIRDNMTCQHCGIIHEYGKVKIHVHHIKPYRLFNGDYESANLLSNLICLCAKCHKMAEHGKITIHPKLL